MKKQLLLLATLALTSTAVKAQNFTAQWEKPSPTEFTTWSPETSCYMYNVDGGGFYIAYQGGGADEPPYWRTRSSVNDTIAAEVRFTRTNPNSAFEDMWDEADDNTYLLVSWVPKFQEFRCTFSEGAFNSVWTDNNTQYDHGWNIIQNADGSFYIEGNNILSVSGYDYTGKYVGVLASDPDRVLYLKDIDAIGSDAVFYDKWKVMTPEAYESYMATAKPELKRYNAAQDLRKAIEDALSEHPSLDLSAQIAVYNNTSSSQEALESAIEGVNKAVIDEMTHGVSPSNPRDLTDLIKNPTFDGRNYDGWSGDRFGAGGDVDDVAEHWNKNYDTYQEIKGLPAGVYVVRVNGFYRAGEFPSQDYNAYRSGNASNAKLYISGATLGEFNTPIKHLTESGLSEGLGLVPGSMETEVELVVDDGTIWLPNTMVGANNYFHLEDNPNLYKSEIAGAIGDGDVLRFGVKKSTLITADWSVFDDFELLYYGDSEEAYQVIVQSMLASNSVNLDGEGVYYGKPEYDAYMAVCSALESSTTIETIQENLPKLEEARTALSNSVSAYAQYINTINDLFEWLIKADQLVGPDLNTLTDYLEEDANGVDYPNGNLRYIIPTYEDGNGAGLLSAEDILKEIDYLNDLREKAIRDSMYDGLDLTDLIKNPGFELGGASGWLTDPNYNGGNITNWHGGTSPNYCAECFNHNFDVYQEIEGLENGLYEVSVQAFYRTTDNQNAENAFNYGYDDAKVLSEVYLNEFSTPVKNVFEIKYSSNLANNCYATSDGYYTLDGMASASAAFSLTNEDQNFTQKVYGLVTDGKLRLGIRNTTGSLNARWTLFDNFKLIFRAKNMSALTSVINNYAERAEALSSLLYGQPEKNALTSAVQTATSASTSDKKYDALIALVDAYNKANASVDAYAELDDALGKLNDALNDAAINNPSSPAYNDAADYYDEIDEAFGNQQLSTEEIQTALTTINEWIGKLRIPGYDEASDSNPVNMTQVIVNPSFDIVNDFTGWTGTSFGTGGDAGANGEHYEHNFDSYQILYGLPAGTYQITVKGMYRHGSPANDFSVFRAAQAAQAEDPDYKDPTLLAFLYAQTESSSVSATIDHTCDGGKTTPDFSGYNAGTTSDPCYVADSRTSADLYFHDEDAPDAYLSTVIIEVKEGETLRIGVKKDGEVLSQSWAIFDDFTLTYFGTNSSLTPSDDPVGISVPSVSESSINGIYTIDGRRQNNLRPGMNIIRMSDGSVRKIFIK